MERTSKWQGYMLYFSLFFIAGEVLTIIGYKWSKDEYDMFSIVYTVYVIAGSSKSARWFWIFLAWSFASFLLIAPAFGGINPFLTPGNWWLRVDSMVCICWITVYILITFYPSVNKNYDFGKKLYFWLMPEKRKEESLSSTSPSETQVWVDGQWLNVVFPEKLEEKKKGFWEIFWASFKKNIVNLPGKLWRNWHLLLVLAVSGGFWAYQEWSFVIFFLVICPLEIKFLEKSGERR
jgi:hypothetical protein